MNASFFNSLFWFGMLLFWLPGATANEPFGDTGRLPCKYSVRDVGFVNVHGNSWQLEFLMPDIDEESFVDLNNAIRNALARSNVDLVWVEELELANHSQTPVTTTVGRVLGDEGAIPIELPQSYSPSDLVEVCRIIVESDSRTTILEAAANSLCVVVLFCGSDPEQNASLQQMVEAAVLQLENQHWALEKPTERPPVSLIISKEEVEKETWLLESLGIKDTELPAVSVIFGQGRQLGDTLTGEQLTKESIVGQASICGRDCECDLDRGWLYGNQFIHRWTLEHERVAEGSLDFDPHSALVIAEVANIIRKNRNSSEPGNIRIGSGLVIHDLDDMDSGESSSQEETAPAENSADDDESPQETTNERPVESTDDEALPGLIGLPIWLIIGLLLVVLAIGGFVTKRNG